MEANLECTSPIGKLSESQVTCGISRTCALGCLRLRFLSRDGQVFYELARRLMAALGVSLDLEYVYSSRLTWSLAATRPDHLSAAPWLFNSFMQSNAADVCARLGLPFGEFEPVLIAAGVSLDPDQRADRSAQAAALRRFVDTPVVMQAVGHRVCAQRQQADCGMRSGAQQVRPYPGVLE